MDNWISTLEITGGNNGFHYYIFVITKGSKERMRSMETLLLQSCALLIFFKVKMLVIR